MIRSLRFVILQTVLIAGIAALWLSGNLAPAFAGHSKWPVSGVLAIQFADYNGLRWGIECGTLGMWQTTDDKSSWAEDNPANHSQGFVILTFDDDGTLLEPEFCRVMNGKAWFRGKAIA